MLGKNLIQAASGAAGAAGALGIEDVFSTWLYAGNSSTQTITNGVDLAGEGGLVWIKSRVSLPSVGVQSHGLFDTERGSNKFLISNQTTAEFTATDGITSFNSDGFSLGAGTTAGYYVSNYTGQSYASWTFRKAPGFFDVVTYTGTGSLQNIAHNLGSVPGFLIVKRTDSASDWIVYHRGLSAPATDNLLLNSTAAVDTSAATWGNTSPTDTQFTVGASTKTNASGATYVAYLFAHDEAIFGEGSDQSVVKCGSYTGNGSSSSGPVIDLGWEPQWVMIKAASTTGDWFMSDTMRGQGVSGSSSQNLYANTSVAEQFSNFIAISSTGFRLTAGVSDLNGSGQTYIYIAIRRGPMKTPTSASEVFSAVARTGTGANAEVTSGFPTDMVIVGNRTIAAANTKFPIWDRLRNTAYSLTTSTTAEINAGTVLVQANPWDTMTGFEVGTTGALTNASGNTFINYLFRRAPGFFDVVAYTGNGSNPRTISHSLTVAPELLIVRRRNAVDDWWVYAGSAGITKRLELNSSNNIQDTTTTWGNTAFTDQVFGVGDTRVNASGGTYIAYLFATCPGVSKVGSYTGTATTQQIDCGFTSGARLIIIKRADALALGDWYVWDTARGIVSGNDPYLLLNSTAAEVTSTDYIDPYSAGFEISSTAPAAINASGGSFIFLAIA